MTCEGKENYSGQGFCQGHFVYFILSKLALCTGSLSKDVLGAAVWDPTGPVCSYITLSPLPSACCLAPSPQVQMPASCGPWLRTRARVDSGSSALPFCPRPWAPGLYRKIPGSEARPGSVRRCPASFEQAPAGVVACAACGQPLLSGSEVAGVGMELAGQLELGACGADQSGQADQQPKSDQPQRGLTPPLPSLLPSKSPWTVTAQRPGHVLTLVPDSQES